MCRPLSVLFYFVPQDSHSQAGSTTHVLDVVHCQTRNKCCSWAASKARAVWANYESKQATKVRVSKSRSSWVKPCEKIEGLMSKARDLCCETLQYGTFCRKIRMPSYEQIKRHICAASRLRISSHSVHCCALSLSYMGAGWLSVMTTEIQKYFSQPWEVFRAALRSS